MGDDTPLAVLSEKPLVLFEYFQQLFAQVTNPPIDAIREKIVVSERMVLGAEGNLIEPVPEDARKIILSHPILNERDAGIIRNANTEGFRSATLSLLYPAGGDGAVMEERLERLRKRKRDPGRYNPAGPVRPGRGSKNAAIPSSGGFALHQQMTRKRKRKDFSLILSPRAAERAPFALLTAFGRLRFILSGF